MKRWAIGFTVVGTLFLCDIRESEGKVRDCPTIALAEIVESRGLRGLFDEVALGLVSAPRINSQWYYRTTSLPAPCWHEERSFFESLVAQVEVLRREMAAQSVDELRESVRTLSNLAEWVGASEGYANLVVEVRLRALMAQGIGQIIVRAKGEVPKWIDSSIEEIVPKLSAPDARARILNNEASVVFVRTPISDSDLRFYWAENESRAFSKGVSPSSIYSNPNPEVARRFERAEVPGALEALYEKGFFQDESCPGRTTILCWDKKRHSRIARLGFPRKEQLVALLEYRRVVGFIPIVEESENGKPLGGLEVFREHWQQRVGLGESRAVASLAWTAARSVRRGYFDDAEYDLVQNSNEMEPQK